MSTLGGPGPGCGVGDGPGRARGSGPGSVRPGLVRALLLSDVRTDKQRRVGRDRRALLVLRSPEPDVAAGRLVVASRECERVRLPDHRQVEDARVENGAVAQARHVRVLRVEPPQRAQRDVAVFPDLRDLADREADRRSGLASGQVAVVAESSRDAVGEGVGLTLDFGLLDQERRARIRLSRDQGPGEALSRRAVTVWSAWVARCDAWFFWFCVRSRSASFDRTCFQPR